MNCAKAEHFWSKVKIDGSIECLWCGLLMAPAVKAKGVSTTSNGTGRMKLVHISFGGPFHRIKIAGEIVHFEMHPYCGPMLVDQSCEPLDDKVLARRLEYAVTKWVQKGRKIRDGLCVWQEGE